MSTNHRPPHSVFNVAYNGIARELCTSATIVDPISNKAMDVKRVIWDTGATATTLNTSVAQALGLIPTGKTQVHTANGLFTANTYVINILLPNKVGVGGLNVSDGDLGPNTDVLVGMDIICLGDFTVQNYDGKTHFSFCMPHFDTKYDMVEKANKINPRILRDQARAKRPN